MKYRLLDILACPYCKDEGFPLKLYVIEERIYKERSVSSEPLCELYCGFKSSFIRNLKSKPPCHECIKHEVVVGVLHCPKCGRWYPVVDEIPRMLPDEYRNPQEEMEFLRRYYELLPRHVSLNGKPFNLKEVSR